MKISGILILLLSSVFITYGKHRLCYPDYPELDGLLCYKSCKSGYNGVGPVCWGRCPSKTTDIGALCIKNTYGRGVGTLPSKCNDGEEKSHLACYKPCKSGYYGEGPVCWEKCPSDYTNDGASCRKDVHATSRWVGNCPWYDACGLCGGPWYNVCGKRRNCGGDCPSGYRNDGCTCWRDTHIYFKDTYGRGWGSILKCGSNKDHGGLCYNKCRSGYTGVGPVCWGTCYGQTIDTGTQCQKKSYGRGVGKVINCFKAPTCCNNSPSLANSFQRVGAIRSFQKWTCQHLYDNIKPFIPILLAANGCFRSDGWKTVSISYSFGAAFGYAFDTEIGVAVDMEANKGICFVGSCSGFKIDISVEAGLVIGYWENIDSIPGDSTVIFGGLDLPGTEVGFEVAAVFAGSLKFKEFIGLTFGLGAGLGLNPIDVGGLKCKTPTDGIVKFTP